MKKIQTLFFCQQCGHQSTKWLGKCPSCNEWNSFVEEEISQGNSFPSLGTDAAAKPLPIDSIESDEKDRLKSGIDELDRVLGGGIVQGSATLIGGDPGIGKSTLLLQTMGQIAKKGLKILYVSGEESARQIKLRGQRIGASSPNLFILVEIALDKVLHSITSLNPAVIVIDSIQTMYTAELSSAAGSVGQIRATAERLILLSKKTGIPCFLIGHVTKDGSIAGPKILEHMVDTVLYFEGDSGHPFRIIRGMKNRYGPTNEIGVFEMQEKGLSEVSNPSALFISERPKDAAGSIVLASLEGTRPILVEMQALVSKTSFGMPRRTTIGVDHNRVSLLAAVIEKICGFPLGGADIFINVAGGVKLSEPATDMGIVTCLISSYLDKAVDAETIVCGEVGLTGEVRGISQVELRIREATRMGFRRCIIPRSISSDTLRGITIKTTRIGNILELLEHLF